MQDHQYHEEPTFSQATVCVLIGMGSGAAIASFWWGLYIYSFVCH